MTSMFLKFESPSTWQWDNTYVVALALSRPLVQYGKYFSIDPEIGVARRFGDAPGVEGWVALLYGGSISLGATTSGRAWELA